VSRQAVCEEGTDHPKLILEPPEVHRKKWTVCDGLVDHQPHHGLSDTLVQIVHKLCAPKTNRQNGSNERRSRTHKEHDEQLVGFLLANRPLVRRQHPELDPLKVNSSFPLSYLPKQLRKIY
jgi:hypothetical protein